MPKLFFTDRSLRALKTLKTQEDFWDNVTPGFGVRATKAGRKTFFCRYRVGKSQRRLMLGDFPLICLADARRKFRVTLNKLEDGNDPQLEKDQIKLAETVSDLFETFFKDRNGRIADSTLMKYKGMYRRELEKPLGSLKAKDLRKAHVIPILRAIAERTPTQCERTQQLLQACMNHAVALDLIEFNPLQKLPAYGYTRVGERHLSAEELVEYLRVIETLPTPERVYYYLLILYGCRAGELAKWQWSWVKHDRIAVPGGHQKNSRALTLPLTAKVSSLLQELHRESGESLWLFPNPEGKNARVSFRKHRLRIENAMNCTETWSLRDLRRTAETQMRELGIDSEIVSGILNHNTTRLRKIYDKSINLPEKRSALMRYERYLSQLKEKGVTEKVIQFSLPVRQVAL